MSSDVTQDFQQFAVQETLRRMKKVDIAAGLAYIASGGLASVAIGFGTIWPHEQTQIVAISGIIVGIAGLITRLLTTPAPPKGN